jgi:hypothetical protein
MARNTGPGKVTDNLDKKPRERLAGLLFNFDVEGDAVKPEHERWLEANAIPLLSCEQAVGNLKGMASRSGTDAYNLQLSQRRVENVKKLLAAKGTSPAKLSALWVGEEAAALAGTADGTEDELARSVSITVNLPPRPTTPFFNREDPSDFEDGFDATARWLMVPTFERRQLVLLHGAGVRLFTSAPLQAQFIDPVTLRPVNELVVTSNRQIIKFAGHVPGTAAITGRDLATGKLFRLLDVEVLAPKRILLALHFVTDPQHPVPGRTIASITEMVRNARPVFARQANVHLDLVSEVPDTLRFIQNLSDQTVPANDGQQPVTLATVGGEGYPVLMNRVNPAIRVNIFFVWEFQGRTPGRDTNGRADDIPGKAVILEDDTGTTLGIREGYTFAHEIGHCLGLSHVESDVGNRDRLMWDTTNQHSGQLTRDEVRTARRNLV